MRRWIFAALVLANLGLLLWGYFYLEPERPEVPQPRPGINPEKMRLLKEVSPKAASRPKPSPAVVEAEPAPIPEAPEKTAETALVCYRLGPLTDIDQAQQLEQALASLPPATLFTRREESEHTTSFRVFLPPFPTKADAERRRRDLTRLGFKDHALMQEEGMHNAISLGLFSVEANAQTQLKRLADKGIVAKLQTQEQTRTVYRLELAPVDSAASTRDRIAALLQGMTGASLTTMVCPTPTAPPKPPLGEMPMTPVN